MNDIDFYDNLSDEQKGMIQAGFHNVLFITEMTDFIIADFIALLKKQGLYRQEVKFRCKLLQKERSAYNSYVWRTMTEDFDNFSDMSDKFFELIKPSYNVFFYSIRNELLKAYSDRTDIVDVLVYMDVLTHLFKFAHKNFYNWAKYFEKNIPEIFKYSGFLRLETNKWNNTFISVVIAVTKAIKYKGREVDNEQMNTAYKIFQSKILDLDYTKKAIQSVCPDELVCTTPPPQIYTPRQRWNVHIE